MKKILSLTLLSLCLSASASFAQIRFAPKIGLNVASMNISAGNSGVSISPDSRIGFQAGVVVDIGISKMFSVQPGLMYSGLGYKMTSGGTTGTLTTNYLQVPINLQLSLPLADEVYFIAQAGPYLGYCLGGKAEAGGQSQDIKVGDDKDIKALDFGLNGAVGIEAFNAQLTAGYGLGLLNVQPKNDFDITAMNRNFYVALAYFIGSRK